MSDRLTEIQTRLASASELEIVVGAMRGIAAARAREARRGLDGIHRCAAMIGAAIGDVLRLSRRDHAPAHAASPGSRVLVVIGTEQGFVGTFNERIVTHAQALAPQPAEYLLVGSRAAMVAAEHGLDTGWSAPMVAHAADVSRLADQITEALYERIGSARATHVSVLHALPETSNTVTLVERTLLPFDFERFAQPAQPTAPLLTLSPEQLLPKLAEEYVYTQLCEMLMLSFAAENEARMRAMVAARENVHDTLDKLRGESQRLRQEEITAEIVELASGNLAASAPQRREPRPDSPPDSNPDAAISRCV